MGGAFVRGPVVALLSTAAPYQQVSPQPLSSTYRPAPRRPTAPAPPELCSTAPAPPPPHKQKHSLKTRLTCPPDPIHGDGRRRAARSGVGIEIGVGAIPVSLLSHISLRSLWARGAAVTRASAAPASHATPDCSARAVRVRMRACVREREERVSEKEGVCVRGREMEGCGRPNLVDLTSLTSRRLKANKLSSHIQPFLCCAFHTLALFYTRVLLSEFVLMSPQDVSTLRRVIRTVASQIVRASAASSAFSRLSPGRGAASHYLNYLLYCR